MTTTDHAQEARPETCEHEEHQDGGMYFCVLPDGHDGAHRCTSACGYPMPRLWP